MSVVLSVSEIGPCRKELRIEVPPPAVAAETQRVLAEYRRQARLPGFRKGKAPESLVGQRFRQEIQQEVVDRLVPRYWRQAEAEKELEPLLPPELKGVDFQPGESLVFTAVVETRPEIEIGDPGPFQLPELEVEPGEGDVERQLEELRRRVATWNPVERPAARGDRVRVEVARESGESDPLTFEVGDPQVWEELSLAVTGLAAGQQSAFDRQGGEGEEKRRFTVVLKQVEEQELPPLDDDLARQISRFGTAAELREQVIIGLRQARRQERYRRREQALLEQLRQKHPLQLPEGVVQHELEQLVRDYAQQLARQGVDLERSGIDWGVLAEQLLPEAQRLVHGRLLLDAVADAREIEISQERLEGVLAEIARARGTSTAAIRRELDQGGKLAGLRRQLRRQEALRQLLGEPDEEGIESAAGTAAEASEP
jgi:trigger factor